MERAAALGRAAHAADPHDHEAAYQLGSALYALGAVHTSRGLPVEAVAALGEAESAYQTLPVDRARPLVADARLRRARAHAASGAGASAVVDAQAAVVAYVRLSSPDRVDGGYLGLARTLMMASDVLAAYADAQMALEAAREGLSWAVDAVNSGRAQRDQDLTQAMIQALGVEIGVLELLGRHEETGNAAGLLAHLGVRQRVILLADTWGVPGLSMSDGGVATAVRAVAFTQPRVGEALSEHLLRHPVGPLVVPAFRTPPQNLADAAEAAAAAAIGQLRHGLTATGTRLGLEAHWLYAFLHDESLNQRIDFTDPLEHSFVLWCQLLGALADHMNAAGNRPLARDLAAWGTKAFMGLNPWVQTPQRVAALDPAVATFARLIGR